MEVGQADEVKRIRRLFFADVARFVMPELVYLAGSEVRQSFMTVARVMQAPAPTVSEVGRVSSTSQEIVFRVRVVRDVSCVRSCVREMCHRCRGTYKGSVSSCCSCCWCCCCSSLPPLVSPFFATFRVARLTLQTRKLWCRDRPKRSRHAARILQKKEKKEKQ